MGSYSPRLRLDERRKRVKWREANMAMSEFSDRLGRDASLEIFTEIWLPHNGLLASKLGKKASTLPGAIHTTVATRVYSREYKRDAAQLVTDRGVSVPHPQLTIP